MTLTYFQLRQYLLVAFSFFGKRNEKIKKGFSESTAYIVQSKYLFPFYTKQGYP